VTALTTRGIPWYRLGSPLKGRVRLRVRNLGLLGALGIVLGALAVVHPEFFNLENARVLSLQMSYVGLASIGMALLIMSGNVDLSVGSIFGLAAVVAATLSLSLNPVFAIGGGIAVAAGLGLANGLLVWRIPISPIIITLGTLTLLRGVTLVVTQGAGVNDVPAGFAAFGQATPLGIPSPVWLFVGVGLGAHIILSRTTIGRHIYAVGGNRDASAMAGLRIRRIVFSLFAINGAIVGLAAVLTASRFAGANPRFGTDLELDAITAAILGGVAFSGGEGGVGGVVLAVALLTILGSAMVSFGINPFFVDVVKGSALLISVGLDQFSTEQRDRYRKWLAMRERGLPKQRNLAFDGQQSSEDMGEDVGHDR
jgi:ribose/xylose/arabinose/galactoside ABC-type transport system permease subunit